MVHFLDNDLVILVHDGLIGDVDGGVHLWLQVDFSGIISTSKVINTNAVLKLDVEDFKNDLTDVIKVEDCLDKSDQMQQERLSEMKRLILELMKKTIKKKMEVRGEKRQNEASEDTPCLQSKPRVTSPPKN